MTFPGVYWLYSVLTVSNLSNMLKCVLLLPCDCVYVRYCNAVVSIINKNNSPVKRQGGESSIVWWRNVLVAKRLGGEPSRWRIVQGANRPDGETSKERTDEGAKRPVTQIGTWPLRDRGGRWTTSVQSNFSKHATCGFSLYCFWP